VISSLTDKVVQAHFALSSQHTFHAGGNNGGRWPYRQFYRDILSVAASMDDNDRQELLDWWDECVVLFHFTTRPLIFTLSQVFRDIKPESESENENENMQPACLSIAARMKMQAKAAAAAKEKAAIDACNVATAAPENNQLRPSNSGNGLADVTNMGPDAAGATA
jgi:hypothetical protein